MSINDENNVPPGMLLYVNGLLPFITHLSDVQAGKLFRALINYHITGDVDKFNEPLLSAAFDIVKQGIDDGRERYNKKIAGSEYGVYCRKEKSEGREPLTREQWETEKQKKEGRLSEIYDRLHSSSSKTNGSA